MSTLVDHEIADALTTGEIDIDGYTDIKQQLQPTSFDLRLSRSIVRIQRATESPEQGHGYWRNIVIDVKKPMPSAAYKEMEVVSDSFIIQSGEFMLCSTEERVRLANCIKAEVEGRSSLGRLGLIVHATAGFVDPGFEGNITLELYNLNPNPLRLYPGMRVCQLVFERTAVAQRPYGHASRDSKYQGDRGAQVSRINLDK